jgi:hypothetical protein
MQSGQGVLHGAVAAMEHHRFKRPFELSSGYDYSGRTGTIMNEVITLPKAHHRPGLLFADHVHRNREQVHNALVAHLGLLKTDKRVLVVSEITGQHVDHFVRRTPWLYVVPAADSEVAATSINAHRAHMPPAMLARVAPAVLLDMTDPSADWGSVHGGFDAVLAVVQVCPKRESGSDTTYALTHASHALPFPRTGVWARLATSSLAQRRRSFLRGSSLCGWGVAQKRAPPLMMM